MQHDKKGEAKYIGKHNTGERGRRIGAEHFERRAAWERCFFQNNERHAAWERSRRGGAEEAPRLPKAAHDPLPPDPQDN